MGRNFINISEFLSFTMVIYSHSRLSTFENCPLKFRYKYLDKIIPPLEKSIEAHLGKVVHDTLEWLYLEVKAGRVPSLDHVVIHYSQTWRETWDDAIKNVKKRYTTKEYFNQGVGYLLDYYMRHKPFDDNTIDVEKKVFIELDKEGRYKIIGFIDRLVYNLKTKEYEIHDYKTGGNLPQPEAVENDRQLGLYSIAIKELFGKEKKVSLIWHYLAFNRRIISQRTNEQLERLKKETIELIKKIESEIEFIPKKSYLCHWCEYKEICPIWNKNPPKTKEEAEKILKKLHKKE